MLAPLPAAVRIRHARLADGAYADVHDAETNELITCDTVHNIGQWLAVLGYVWVVGSNGCWSRPDA